MNRTKHLSYKTLSAIVLIVALFAYLPGAPAQTLLPARQVSVSTNAFTNLSPAVATAQSTFEAIDQSSLALSVAVASNTAAVASNTASLSAVVPLVQSNNALVVSNAALVSTMSGVVSSNAATMAYNARANNWNFTNTLLSVFLDLFANTNDSYRVILDRPAFTSNYLAAIALNDTNALTMPGLYSNMYARLDTLFSNHFTTVVVPFVDGGDSTNATLIYSVRNEVLNILAEFGYVSYTAFGFQPDTYFSDFQTFTVPEATNAPVGTEFMVRLWGGGGSGNYSGAGGYTTGIVTVVSQEVYSAQASTNPAVVTNGQPIYVQVGAGTGRAAIWRAGGTNGFNTMSNELLVAGGGGQGGDGGGNGGGTVGASPGAGGGTQVAGGAGQYGGPAGTRLWGGAGTHRKGGDGYYGGGGCNFGADMDAGGGSGYVAPGIVGGTLASTGLEPIGTAEQSYSSFAGRAGTAWGWGNSGRVVFERLF